jgi:hypothetical protein
VVGVPSRKRRNDHERYYTVLKGRTTGVFTRWCEAKEWFIGYSGAIYSRFWSEQEAHGWLSDQGWEQYADDALDISADKTLFDRTVYKSHREPGPAGSDPVQPGGLTLSVKDIVDLAKVGPSSSARKPLEVQGTSIQVETKIVKILCPKGMTASAKKELTEASPDVLSLPGNLGSATNDPAKVMDQFAGAVNDITTQRAARTGVQSRDTQWKIATHNVLDKIKTANDLSEMVEETSSQSDSVYQSF